MASFLIKLLIPLTDLVVPQADIANLMIFFLPICFEMYQHCEEKLSVDRVL